MVFLGPNHCVSQSCVFLPSWKKPHRDTVASLSLSPGAVLYAVLAVAIFQVASRPVGVENTQIVGTIEA